jgi:hypothetical protein
MTQNKKVRPAMAAIAAVIALSTPSFAQSAGESVAAASAPAIEVKSAPLPADPLAPAPVAVTPVADPLAAMPPGKPATAKSTAARPPPAAPRAAGAEPMISATGATISDPDAATPAEPLANQAGAQPAQPPIAEPSALADSNANGSLIPVAGVAVLGILLLAGAGLAMRRRRRLVDDADDAARRQFAGTSAASGMTQANGPVPMPEPVAPATAAETAAVAAAVVAAHEPSPAVDGPVTELPEDFDTSQLGLHAQAAYNGPTEDNPSLSLKHRLTRANGMDQLAEREAEAEVAADAIEEAAAKPAAAPLAKDLPIRAGTTPSPKSIIRPA